ncbi:MAG: manganese transport protein [Pirellulaceae bacterium]|jgi:Mn2+/Fe2+ NRAMP family transporter
MNILEFVKRVGPALIVTAVVLGPGSITASTKVGAAFGYSTLWILVVLLILLIGVTSLAAWLGATSKKTLCSELSEHLGGWAGKTIGIAFFGIVAGFQFSNNVGVIAGLEPLFPILKGVGYRVAVLVVMNAAIIAILYSSSDLYKQVERIMKFFILAMVAAFLINFLWSQPSASKIAIGLVPNIAPFQDADNSFLLMGLIGTTFSVAGAFYQGYLVREKGWGPKDVKSAFYDSVFGMFVLIGVTSIVLMTSAATFHGKFTPDELNDASKMSTQLQSAFGPMASYIFCFGFLAGAFSSFLVNAMIGGHVFSDGMGFGSELRSGAVRNATTAAMLIGMAVALIPLTNPGMTPTTAIMVAQASTVIGCPAVMLGLLYLGIRQRREGEHKTPMWMLVIVSIGTVISFGFAIRTTFSLIAKLTAPEVQ